MSFSAFQLKAVAASSLAHYEAQRRRDRAEMQRAERQLAYWGDVRLMAPTRCPCCGSREFRKHHERTVCAYCRSGT